MAITVSNMAANSGINYSGLFSNASNNRNTVQNSISNMWSSYNSAQNAASSTAVTLQEVRTNAAALVASYDEAKTEFYNEFDGNMSQLRDSAEALRNFDFRGVTAETPETPETAFSAASKVISAVTENAEKATAQTDTEDAPKEIVSPTAAAAKVIEASNQVREEATVNAASISVPTSSATTYNAGTVVNRDGSVTTTSDGVRTTSYGGGAMVRTESYDASGHMRVNTAYSQMMQSAFKTVNDFVENYNGTMEFLKDNASVSARTSKMADIFADTRYNAKSYEAIGINVNNDGTLSLDQEKFAQAVIDNPDRVSSVLGGAGGLAEKAENRVDLANSQRSQLFPSAQSMFGDNLSTAAFYTSGAFISNNSFSTLGNLVNMMF